MVDMKKMAVIIGGWHYASQFYESMISQKVPKGWEIDYYVIAHRLPDCENSISEKESIRNYIGDNILMLADKKLYEKVLTEQSLTDMGWIGSLHENTFGDLEFFNQWNKEYDVNEYDLFFVSHDDNLILSNELFTDLLEEKVDLYGLDVDSFNPKNRHCSSIKYENKLDWLFVDNGWHNKRITPRWSFGFYTKKLIDIIGGKFIQFEGGDYGDNKLKRIGEFNSFTKHDDLHMWNAPAAQFMELLINMDLLGDIRYLSQTKRVSKYCIEGERGFIHNSVAGGQENYIRQAVKALEETKI
jgi:hypothetical protein